MTDKIDIMLEEFSNYIQDGILDAVKKAEEIGIEPHQVCKALSMMLLEKCTSLLCYANIINGKDSEKDVENKIRKEVYKLLKLYKEGGMHKDSAYSGKGVISTNIRCGKCNGRLSAYWVDTKYEYFCPRCSNKI